jgi:hypothetical protein
MEKPEAIFIGFFPKKTHRPPAPLEKSTVEEFCSVSEHISKGPDGWIDRWQHNLTWWLFDTETAAWGVTGEDREAYDMYAYKLVPLVFDGTAETRIAVQTTATESLVDYRFLGYDIVSRSTGTSFECSPLSCNYGYQQYPVNRCCLIDDFREAWRIAREMARASREKHAWEPGPYYLVEVYRRRTRG